MGGIVIPASGPKKSILNPLLPLLNHAHLKPRSKPPRTRKTPPATLLALRKTMSAFPGDKQNDALSIVFRKDGVCTSDYLKEQTR